MSNKPTISDLTRTSAKEAEDFHIASEFDLFKADLSKVLFTITERLTRLEDTTKSYMLNLNDLYFKQEAKIASLDQERIFLEGRIQTLEKQVITLQEDITTLEEDTEITEEHDYEASIDYREARDER